MCCQFPVAGPVVSGQTGSGFVADRCDLWCCVVCCAPLLFLAIYIGNGQVQSRQPTTTQHTTLYLAFVQKGWRVEWQCPYFDISDMAQKKPVNVRKLQWNWQDEILSFHYFIIDNIWKTTNFELDIYFAAVIWILFSKNEF